MDIALYTIRTIALIITQPISIFGIIVFAYVFYKQNKKTVVMQKMIIGEPLNSPFELTISQIVIGILAGVLGSVILSYLGVMFDEHSAIGLIFLVSLLLMFVNPRYICFSYSGAIIGFISVVLNEIAVLNKGVVVSLFGQNINLSNIDFLKIDVVSLMTLVGVLHIIEGLLVLVDGRKGSIPVFTNRDGNIVGGFALKRYWLLPVTIMVLAVSTGTDGTGAGITLTTPNGWPFINSALTIADVNKVIISILPLFAGIGYNSITFTKDKTQKTLISGGMIFTFGLALAIVAQIGNINFFTKLLVIAFAPIAHEVMLRFAKHIELKGEMKYVSTGDSIMILDVAPNTPAQEMGIKSGDKIIEINNRKIENEEQIINIMTGTSNFFWFKIERPSGQVEEVHYNKMNPGKRLGIVFVPMGVPKDSVVVKFDETKFSEVLNKMKNKKDE
jgi:hypothetical protein